MISGGGTGGGIVANKMPPEPLPSSTEAVIPSFVTTIAGHTKLGVVGLKNKRNVAPWSVDTYISPVLLSVATIFCPSGLVSIVSN